jgi:hypothetical protein
MALIWHTNDGGQSWMPGPLQADRYQLGTNGLTTIDNNSADGDKCDLLMVRRHAEEEEWILIASPESKVRLNSISLLLGVRVLRDHDEILIHGANAELMRFFYSTERLVQVEPFPAMDGISRCPRCKQSILSGDLAVQCPNPRCRIWHHQKEELPCWSYESTCAQCGWSTNLNADYHWTPEAL